MTKLILWDKKLSVGVNEIDKQHQKLIGIINSVYEKRDRQDKKISDDINNLVEFSRVHFSTEEKYFEKWNYPFTEEHNSEHEKMILKVLEFSDRFEKGETILEELAKFLKSWLEKHLKKHDFKYRDYIKNNNLI